jgi:hypothetical protein
MTKGEKVLGLFASAPRYESFYTLFERAGANVEQATTLLAKLITEWPDDGARFRFELKELTSSSTSTSRRPHPSRSQMRTS